MIIAMLFSDGGSIARSSAEPGIHLYIIDLFD